MAKPLEEQYLRLRLPSRTWDEGEPVLPPGYVSVDVWTCQHQTCCSYIDN